MFVQFHIPNFVLKPDSITLKSYARLSLTSDNTVKSLRSRAMDYNDRYSRSRRYFKNKMNP